jgi:hypothetical protein
MVEKGLGEASCRFGVLAPFRPAHQRMEQIKQDFSAITANVGFSFKR